MTNFKDLKNSQSIFDLTVNLKKLASTGGGEWGGPCPFCGGTDRFRVQPKNNIWLCRNCTGGKWRDVIDFIALRDKISISEAAAKLAKDKRALSSELTTAAEEGARNWRPTRKYTPYEPPSIDWQDKARRAAAVCKERLYSPSGAGALGYLVNRGFISPTLLNFGIGYSPGFSYDGLFIPKGITIPCEAGGQFWYLKIRTDNPKQRYLLVKGSKPKAIFNADDLAYSWYALIVEGEFNAMIAYQHLNDFIALASIGSAGYRPDDLAQWGKYFFGKKLVLTLYDNDSAGQIGQIGLSALLGDRAKPCYLPPGSGSDLNEFYLKGGCLWDWLKVYFEMYDPLPKKDN